MTAAGADGCAPMVEDVGDGEAARAARLVLAHVVEPGDEHLGSAIARSGPADVLERLRGGSLRHPQAEVLRARLARSAEIDAHPNLVEERAELLGARVVTPGDREWPGQLSGLGASEPLALWVRGAADLRLLAFRSVAVVGARACTAYGEDVARSWSADLAGDGWSVVSGAAFGIDAAAHRGALAADGTTIAILAGGVDVPYPRAHAPLLEAIVDSGVVISESPPGETARRHRFLTRNRIIAALGRATVVVEAAVRSGAAATARDATALHRPVLAVPGPVSSAASAGCHRMIQDGEAVLAADVEDVRAALDLTAMRTGEPAGASAPPAGEVVRRDRDRLGLREQLVLDALPRRRALALDELVTGAGLGAGEVLAATGTLVALGWLEEVAGGWRLLRT